MQFMITGKHIEITGALRDHAESKTSKLPRYYSSIQSVEVVLDNSEGGNAVVEMIARGEHNKVFVVKEASNGDNDMYACIDIAVHKLERQLSRAKGKERSPLHAAPPENV